MIQNNQTHSELNTTVPVAQHEEELKMQVLVSMVAFGHVRDAHLGAEGGHEEHNLVDPANRRDVDLHHINC